MGSYEKMLDEYKTNSTYGRGEMLPHHHHLIPAVLKLLPKTPGLKAMDVGCGNGFITNQISQQGIKITGVDFDQEALDIAKKAYPHLDFVRHEAEDRFPDFAQGIDMITAFEVIEHIYSPQKFLRNVFNTLKPGGYAIFSTPYHGYWKNMANSILGRWDRVFTVHWESGHIKFFSEDTLRKMLQETGFTNVTFNNAGHVPYLWKTLVVRAQKP